MASRVDLQYKLEELLGSKNVYYQSPGDNEMKYPAIKYSKSNIKSTFANNKKYVNTKRYELTVISRTPDNPVIDKLLELPYCSFDRHYNASNLNHDVLILYW